MNAEGKQFDRNGVTGEIFRIEAISRRDVRKDASRGARRAGRASRNRISNLLRLIENTGVKCVRPLGASAIYIYTYRGVVLTNENLRRVSNHTETRKQPSACTNGGAPRGPPLDCDKRVVECRPVTAAAAKLPRNGSEMRSRRDSGRQSATWWGGGGPGVAGAEAAFVCFSKDCRIICR